MQEKCLHCWTSSKLLWEQRERTSSTLRWTRCQAEKPILVLATPSSAQLGQDGHLKIIILIKMSLTCHNTKKRTLWRYDFRTTMHPLSRQFGAFWGYPGGSAVKNTPTAQEIACNAGDKGSIPGYLHNHHSSKDTETFHHPRNFPHIPLPLITTPSIIDGHWHVKEL